MRGAVAPETEDPAASFEEVFRANGWTGTWRNGIYPYDHYHSTAHEVLGIACGGARVRFGGEGGREVEVEAGDVIAIPAGVAHRLVDERDGFLVVGAYAAGRSWDIVRPRPGNLEPAQARIAVVPLPEADPVAGAAGPLLRLWTGDGAA